jgi:hypothetical protein
MLRPEPAGKVACSGQSGPLSSWGKLEFRRPFQIDRLFPAESPDRLRHVRDFSETVLSSYCAHRVQAFSDADDALAEQRAGEFDQRATNNVTSFMLH